MNTRRLQGQKRTLKRSGQTTVTEPQPSCPSPAIDRLLADIQQTANLLQLAPSEQSVLLRQQAFICARRGDYPEAIALFDLLIAQKPENAAHYNNRGLLYFQNGQFTKALADYHRAIEFNPQLAQVYNNRANCYAALGCLEAAIADYETAIDLNPVNLHARINLGITQRDLGHYAQAQESFDQALQLSQLLSDEESYSSLLGHIYAERGRAHHLAGDWNCAVADYQHALAQLPQVDFPTTTSERLHLQVQTWLECLLG